MVFTTGQTLARKFARTIDEMGKGYDSLGGGILHVNFVRQAFERGAERGVIWDQEIFYLLDRLAKESPRVWTNWPH